MNDWDLINSELQRLHLLLHKSENAELKVWALNQLNKLHENYLTPQEVEYEYITEDDSTLH